MVQATRQAQALFESFGAKLFVRNANSLYLWALLPGVSDSMTLAQTLTSQKVDPVLWRPVEFSTWIWGRCLHGPGSTLRR